MKCDIILWLMCKVGYSGSILANITHISLLKTEEVAATTGFPVRWARWRKNLRRKIKWQ